MGLKRIGIYGFSIGGSTVILTAAQSDAFFAVVADSAFTSLKDQARTAITDFYYLPSFPFLNLAVIGYELYRTRVEKIALVNVIAQISLSLSSSSLERGQTHSRRKRAEALCCSRQAKRALDYPGADHGGTFVAAVSMYGKKVGEFFDENLK